MLSEGNLCLSPELFVKMGNGGSNSACCTDTENTLPGVYDMVNPQRPQQTFFNAGGPCSTVEDERDAQEEAALEQVSRLAARGSDNSLRMQLLTATRQDDAAAVLQYVADGADIADMAEALRLAAQRGSASVVRELIAVGLTVNDSCPHSGFTPLQLASASGHLTVCELLLDALADVHRSIAGATAITLAHKMGNTEVEEVLERHLASLVREEGEGGEDPVSRRAHVLPRVSPVLSEAILQALPTPSASALGSAPEAVQKEDTGQSGPGSAPPPARAERSP